MIEIGKYQHFKGNFYQVIHIAKHSETEELMVVYYPLNTNKKHTEEDEDINAHPDIWVRPLSLFNETIERQGKRQKRFSFVNAK